MYVPQNYDRSFHGTVSVRTALASSLNVPAVRTLGLVGLDRFHDVLKRLGFDSLTQTDDFYGTSLALGGADVDLLALANAYRVLANGGLSGPVRFIFDKAQGESRRVLGAPASYIVTDILADRGARALSFGLENPLATRVWSAAKTGTSKDMRDNWCVGFTSRYTVGVWVGNFSGAPMRDVSGATGAAPIWRDIVHRLHAGEESLRPRAPSGLIEQTVRFEPAIEAERREWFIAGTQSSLVRAETATSSEAAMMPRIRYPAEDTIIALDPDIAPSHQRVVLEATAALPGMRWRMRDAVLADTRGRADWTPTPGRHIVKTFRAGRLRRKLQRMPCRQRSLGRAAFGDRLASPQPDILSTGRDHAEEDDHEYRRQPHARLEPACGSRHDEQKDRELDEGVDL